MPRNASYCCFSSSSPPQPPPPEEFNEFKIPIVDFSSFLSLDTTTYSTSTKEKVTDGDNITISSAQKSTAAEIDAANKRHGFVCLRNTGIDKETIEKAFHSAQELFLNLDDNTKDNILKKIDPVTNTGYAGFGVESLNRGRRPDLKEAFNVRNPSSLSSSATPPASGSTSAPTSDFYRGTPEGFRKNSTQLWNELQILGYRFSICCALALGFEKDYFIKTLKDMDLCTLRMLHYPPCDDIIDGTDNDDDGGDGDGDGGGGTSSTMVPIRVGEHTDFGIFTFLFVRDFHHESSHGLQVKAVNGGDLPVGRGNKDKDDEDDEDDENKNFYTEGWNNVVFDEETLEMIDDDTSCAVIVNTGALMARWTNDVWRATAHRVIVPPLTTSTARSSHRYSIAMFFDPDKDTVCSVHPKLVEENRGVAKYEPIKSIDYLLMKLNEAQKKGVNDKKTTS